MFCLIFIFASYAWFCAYQHTSRYRVPAVLPPQAFRAVQSHPDLIELLHGLAHQLGFVGEDTRLEVAGVGPFHPDACAGEVRAAEIDRATVEDQHLKMDPRAEHPFQPFRQRRVFVEVLAEGGAGFLGVDEAHLHALAHQLRQHGEERQRALPHPHVEVLDVGGANPQRPPDGGHSGEDEVVVVGIGDVGEHNTKMSKSF